VSLDILQFCHCEMDKLSSFCDSESFVRIYMYMFIVYFTFYRNDDLLVILIGRSM
jgi:hypothetical protein